jgi:hypothetical protein
MKLFGDKLKSKINDPTDRDYGRNSGGNRGSIVGSGSGNKPSITKKLPGINSARTTGRSSIIETKPPTKQESFLSTLKPIDKNLKGMNNLI